jgi:hypothetical protein
MQKRIFPYYFQFNTLVVWMAADSPTAETALADALNFNPMGHTPSHLQEGA